MNKRIKLFFTGILFALLLSGCGEDEELTQFKDELDAFCVNISAIDSKINSIDTSSPAYIDELLTSLDELNKEFETFASLDFPEEYNYLETTADEASSYMAEAVKSFRDAFTNETYTEESFNAQYKYARENYSRAYKRIQIIITLLHGEEPEGVLVK